MCLIDHERLAAAFYYYLGIFIYFLLGCTVLLSSLLVLYDFPPPCSLLLVLLVLLFTKPIPNYPTGNDDSFTCTAETNFSTRPRMASRGIVLSSSLLPFGFRAFVRYGTHVSRTVSG